jgi:pimeloyl-ACP methyl ester carboxylesterase
MYAILAMLTCHVYRPILLCTMHQIPAASDLFSRQRSQSSPTIAYRVRRSTGPVVVLLHGVGSSSSTWDELLPLLGEQFTVIAADYRGHGESDAPEPPYALADFVDDHFRLLDELGIQTAHVVGFSIGAIIAQAIALAQPSRTSSLVLLNTIGARTPEERARALERLEIIRSSDPHDVAEASAVRWFSPDFIARRPDLVRGEVDIVAATRAIPYAAAYEVLATTELIDQIDTIGCPVLIVTGENDVGSTPRMSRAVQERLPGSELVVVDDLRHYLHIEAAEYIAGLITGFLGDLPSNQPK